MNGRPFKASDRPYSIWVEPGPGVDLASAIANTNWRTLSVKRGTDYRCAQMNKVVREEFDGHQIPQGEWQAGFDHDRRPGDAATLCTPRQTRPQGPALWLRSRAVRRVHRAH